MAMSSAWHSKACWQRGSAATMAVSASTSPATHNNSRIVLQGNMLWCAGHCLRAMLSAWHSRASWQRGSAATTSPATCKNSKLSWYQLMLQGQHAMASRTLSRAKLSAANDKSSFLQQVMRSLQDNIAQHARRGGGGGRGGGVSSLAWANRLKSASNKNHLDQSVLDQSYNTPANMQLTRI